MNQHRASPHLFNPPASRAVAAAPTRQRRYATLVACAFAALLSACATAPQAPPPPASTGAAGGGTSVGADSSLETCPAPVGTVRLYDGQAQSANTGRDQVATSETIQNIRLLLGSIKDVLPADKSKDEGVSIDALRLLIQQSNCLVIVDRGAAEAAASDEKARSRGPNTETRADSNMGRGQEVAADFVLRSSVLAVGTEQASGFSMGSLLPKFAQGLSGSESTTSAKVQLVLSDVRAKIQLAVAQGNGSGKNTSMAASVLGRAGGLFGGGSAKTQSNTSAATVVLQAFADAYNKLVPALRNYKAQTVNGGLGAGGTLSVQGASRPAAPDPK
jgi:hypothetical protein